jgi:hypothetical protein
MGRPAELGEGAEVWGKHLPLYIAGLQFRYDARLTRGIFGTAISGC